MLTAQGSLPPSLVAPSAHLDTVRELIRQGRVTDALAELTDARALARSVEERAGLTAAMIDCRLARGDLAEAMALAAELSPYLDLPGLPGAVVHHVKGELASALGDPDLAVEHFTAAGELTDDSAEHLELVPWRSGAVLALVRAGHRRAATDLADAHLAAAVASGSSYAVALALRTMGTAHPGGERLAILRRARGALAGLDAARLAAQIDTDLAGLLILEHAATATAEALLLLRAAEEYATGEQLRPLQGRVRRLLDRAGEVPKRPHSEALASLTASERRVARLAAQGLTNRQIAEELVVTVKAVEWHLSHVYRKLGISSRTHLASTLGAPVQAARDAALTGLTV
ncbi:MAG: regulatory protein LuxR [Nocardioides sp.]|nr:regulatory protein LuxR [Nocardioides sp.]